MRTALAPVSAVASLEAYRSSNPPRACDLRLDGNEGPEPSASALEPLAFADPAVVRSYPSTAALRQRLARLHGVMADQVLVTAGADDGLDRACRALLCGGRRLVAPVPTFAMLLHYARLTGASVDEIHWPGGAYPVDEVLAAVQPQTTAVAMVTPNNPTGAQATAGDLRRVAAVAPLVWLDHAYVEFGDHDLTPLALELGNVLVFRTLSKAWGLAGLRVGYVLGPATVLQWLSRVGLPYPVSGPSLWLAQQRLADPSEVATFVAAVRRRRAALAQRLVEAGFDVPASGGNFVLARGQGASQLWSALADDGIAIRAWPHDPSLADAVRITVPVDDRDEIRLMDALDRVLGGAP